MHWIAVTVEVTGYMRRVSRDNGMSVFTPSPSPSISLLQRLPINRGSGPHPFSINASGGSSMESPLSTPQAMSGSGQAMPLGDGKPGLEDRDDETAPLISPVIGESVCVCAACPQTLNQ